MRKTEGKFATFVLVMAMVLTASGPLVGTGGRR